MDTYWHKIAYYKHGTNRSWDIQMCEIECTSRLLTVCTHSLHLTSIIGQPGGQGSSGVPLIIKPTHLLTKHCSEWEWTKPWGKVFTRDTKADSLWKQEREMHQSCYSAYSAHVHVSIVIYTHVSSTHTHTPCTCTHACSLTLTANKYFMYIAHIHIHTHTVRCTLRNTPTPETTPSTINSPAHRWVALRTSSAGRANTPKISPKSRAKRGQIEPLMREPSRPQHDDPPLFGIQLDHTKQRRLVSER